MTKGSGGTSPSPMHCPIPHAATRTESACGYNARMTLLLDNQMEQASEALAKMDYLACESLCEAALAQAKRQGDWAYYGRILLPLQECRRQRRMIAAEGAIRLGTSAQGGGPATWLEHLASGCIVITHPHSHGEAARLLHEVRERRLFIEVLFADSRVNDSTWRIATFTGQRKATVEIPAPPVAERDRWLLPASGGKVEKSDSSFRGATPPKAQWFVEASEKLGDALLAGVKATSPFDLVDVLEACLVGAPDHEILHQRLAEAAKAARLTK